MAYLNYPAWKEICESVKAVAIETAPLVVRYFGCIVTLLYQLAVIYLFLFAFVIVCDTCS